MEIPHSGSFWLVKTDSSFGNSIETTPSTDKQIGSSVLALPVHLTSETRVCLLDKTLAAKRLVQVFIM